MKMNKITLVTIFLFPSCCFSNNIKNPVRDVSVIEDSNGNFKWKIDLGYQLIKNSVIILDSSSGGNSNLDPYGRLSDGYDHRPAVNMSFPIESLTKIFKGKFIVPIKLGVNINTAWDIYNFSHQEIIVIEKNQDGVSEEVEKFVNLGTSGSGYWFSIVPTAYVMLEVKSLFQYYLGLGLGGGYMNSKGDSYITDNVDGSSCESSAKSSDIEDIKLNCKKLSYDKSGFGRSTSLIVGLSFKNYGLSIVKTDTTIGNISAEAFVWNLSYTYSFSSKMWK